MSQPIVWECVCDSEIEKAVPATHILWGISSSSPEEVRRAGIGVRSMGVPSPSLISCSIQEKVPSILTGNYSRAGSVLLGEAWDLEIWLCALLSAALSHAAGQCWRTCPHCEEKYSYPDAQLGYQQIPNLRYHVCPPQHLSNLWTSRIWDKVGPADTKLQDIHDKGQWMKVVSVRIQ